MTDFLSKFDLKALVILPHTAPEIGMQKRTVFVEVERTGSFCFGPTGGVPSVIVSSNLSRSKSN